MRMQRPCDNKEALRVTGASLAADSLHPLRLTTNKTRWSFSLHLYLFSILGPSENFPVFYFSSSRCKSNDTNSHYNGYSKRRSSSWKWNGCNRLLIIVADTYYITRFRLRCLVASFFYSFVKLVFVKRFPSLFIFLFAVLPLKFEALFVNPPMASKCLLNDDFCSFVYWKELSYLWVKTCGEQWKLHFNISRIKMFWC